MQSINQSIIYIPVYLYICWLSVPYGDNIYVGRRKKHREVKTVVGRKKNEKRKETYIETITARI